jgi:hypothetical protein
MKKQIFALLIAAAFGASAQHASLVAKQTAQGAPRAFQPQTNSADMSVLVGDTLQYFYNKHFFRNTYNGTQTSPNGQFYGLYQPYPTATVNITHCGGIFYNASPTQIVGLEGAVYRHNTAQSTNVPIRLYLCSLNGANMPILPALDSVSTTVPPTPNGFVFVGGNFTTAVTVNGNFAVLFRNVSTNTADTVRLIMNNASTATSTVPVQQRFGEGMGRLRFNGNFQTNTNTFGTGTDYEFIVQPRVSFSYSAGASVFTPTICTNGLGVFLNQSGPSQLENRQFNFNQFYRHWSPWSLTTNSLISLVTPDSVYRWDFTGAAAPTSYQKHATMVFNTPGVQTASLEAAYRYSANLGNYATSLTETVVNTITVTINNAPVISITGGTAICSGNSTTLTATGAPSFTWTNPATVSSSVIVNPNVSSVYSVSSNQNGCVGTATFQVIVSQPPNLNITAPVQVCRNQSYVMSATGASNYTWSTGSNTSSVTVISATPGVASYTVYALNPGCAQVQGVANVIVNDLPTVLLTAESNTVCSKATGGATIALSGSPSGGVYTGNGVTTTGSFVPNNPGIFVATYSYTDTNTGCSKSATVAITVSNCPPNTASLPVNGAVQNLQVFPNPAVSGRVQLHNIEGMSTVTVYNVLGAPVSRVTTDKSEINLDLSVLPQGNYLIRVTGDNGRTQTVRVVKLD